MSHAEFMTPEPLKPEADKSKRQSALAPAGLLGCPFKDRQKVSLARWDKHSPPWDRMGECIVIGQRKTRGCESGWMVKVMAKDGTYRELDSHWLEQPNEKS
jgi:hypothetical protein